MAGFLAARLGELPLSQVVDPRKRRGRRWPIDRLLSAVLLGLMAGERSLKDIEALTAEMSVATRRLLGIGRRVADTTLRDFLCRLEPVQLRQLLALVIDRQCAMM